MLRLRRLIRHVGRVVGEVGVYDMHTGLGGFVHLGLGGGKETRKVTLPWPL